MRLWAIGFALFIFITFHSYNYLFHNAHVSMYFDWKLRLDLIIRDVGFYVFGLIHKCLKYYVTNIELYVYISNSYLIFESNQFWETSTQIVTWSNGIDKLLLFFSILINGADVAECQIIRIWKYYKWSQVEIFP